MNVIIWQRARAALEWQRHLAVYYFSCRKRNPPPYLAPNRSHSPTDNHSSIRVFHLPYNGTFSHEVLMALEKWRPNVYGTPSYKSESIQRNVIALSWRLCGQDCDFLRFSVFISYTNSCDRRLLPSSSLGFILPSFPSPAESRFACMDGNYPWSVITLPVIARHWWL